MIKMNPMIEERYHSLDSVREHECLVCLLQIIQYLESYTYVKTDGLVI